MPRMTGSQYLAEVIKRQGATHVFFKPTIILETMAALEDTNIRRVVTHGEKSAAYMADGYARASHTAAFCAAQNVGAANLAAGLRDAYMAHSPVIAITGGANPPARYRYMYQDVEDFSMFDHVTKANFAIDEVDRLADTVAHALKISVTGAPGPVHLRMKGSHAQVLEKEAEFELPEHGFPYRFPYFRPGADAGTIKRAVAVLTRARKPAIVAGGGIVASDAAGEVVALAEHLGIPVATSLHGKGIIAENHPLSLGVVGTYSRHSANKAIAEADLVFFIGSRAGSQITNNWKIPRPGTTVMHLDIDPTHLGRNYPAEVEILGDVKVATAQLLAETGSQPRSWDETWIGRVQKLVSEWREAAAPMRESDAVPIRPERLCKELTEVLPDNGVVVADTGHSGIWTGTMMELTSPDQAFYRCAGSLGWAFPASLGIKCALPDRPVVCFNGDGGFFYHLTELETAARFGINAVIIVNNNHSLSQEQRLFNAAYGGEQRGRAHEMWVFKEVNLANVAREMGCVGIRVEHPKDIKPAIQEALGAGKPAVVDVVTDIGALHERAWG